jgi:Uma2 family endonuclease
MRAVLVDAPKSLLEERRRRGLDVFDEVWDGILHMVPPPSTEHQRLGSRLHLTLGPIAASRGFEPFYESGVFDPAAGDSNYRVPDLAFARPEDISKRGIEGKAALVIEILSPGDETRDKLPFYAAVGVAEIWIVDPATRQCELYVLRGQRYHAALPGDDGSVRSPALAVSLATVAGPRLRIAWSGGDVEI